MRLRCRLHDTFTVTLRASSLWSTGIRGAGRSNHVDFDENTMTFEQYILDVHEMTVCMKERFGQEKNTCLAIHGAHR